MFKFFREVFQDTDGGYSSKRAAFFIFILLFCGLTGAVLFHAVDATVVGFATSTLDKITDIIKWLGAYILADKAPAALSAMKGTPTHEKSTTITETVTGPTGG